ncbi:MULTISPECIES: hypothetical protein [unclassified Yoonia]|uniref:hypothetical protein n=1 Tax=unclassified Yoonia TaxID=2629118 RepID=UPI002AFF0E4E|nr:MULTISPECIES: hypothetical protein [unclassified Yoonia]
MRLIVLALAMLPAAAFAQETTLPTPAEPVAQSCPVGMTFNAATQSCGIMPETTTPMPAASGGYGCSFSAAREVTS